MNLEEFIKFLITVPLVVCTFIYCRHIWYRKTKDFDMNEEDKRNEIDLNQSALALRQAGEKKLFLLAYLASDQDVDAFRLHYFYCEPEKADKEAALHLLKIDDASQAEAFVLTQLTVDCEYRARVVNCLVEQAKEKKAKTT